MSTPCITVTKTSTDSEGSRASVCHIHDEESDRAYPPRPDRTAWFHTVGPPGHGPRCLRTPESLYGPSGREAFEFDRSVINPMEEGVPMSRNTRTVKGSVLLVTTALVLTACGGVGDAAQPEGENGIIGISMPTQSSERWVRDGSNMSSEFEELGYGVDLQYAEDVVQDQLSQIENMITRGSDALVIASFDGEALGDVLDMAADSDIPVIAYDRLIMGSEHVDYYATFDNFEVGVLKGEYIVDALDLENEDGPFNIELFGGAPDDNNAYFFNDGAMSVLQPYIDDGVLEVRSGQTSMEQIATQRWDGSIAQSRMDNLLSANYSGEEVDAVLSPFDGISLGVIESLRSAGYGSDSRPLPVITG